MRILNLLYQIEISKDLNIDQSPNAYIYEGKVNVILYQLWYQNSIKHINTL